MKHITYTTIFYILGLLRYISTTSNFPKLGRHRKSADTKETENVLKGHSPNKFEPNRSRKSFITSSSSNKRCLDIAKKKIDDINDGTKTAAEPINSVINNQNREKTERGIAEGSKCEDSFTINEQTPDKNEPRENRQKLKNIISPETLSQDSYDTTNDILEMNASSSATFDPFRPGAYAAKVLKSTTSRIRNAASKKVEDGASLVRSASSSIGRLLYVKSASEIERESHLSWESNLDSIAIPFYRDADNVCYLEEDSWPTDTEPMGVKICEKIKEIGFSQSAYDIVKANNAGSVVVEYMDKCMLVTISVPESPPYENRKAYKCNYFHNMRYKLVYILSGPGNEYFLAKPKYVIMKPGENHAYNLTIKGSIELKSGKLVWSRFMNFP